MFLIIYDYNIKNFNKYFLKNYYYENMLYEKINNDIIIFCVDNDTL